MRVREVASILGVSRYTIYKWIKRGKISYVVLPTGRIRIPESEVKDLLVTKRVDEGVEDRGNKN